MSKKITKRWLKRIGFKPSGHKDGCVWLESEDGFCISVRLQSKNIKWLYCGPVKNNKCDAVALPEPGSRAEAKLLCRVLDFPVKKRR